MVYHLVFWTFLAWLLAPAASSDPPQSARATQSLTDLKLLRILQLEGTTYHVRGVDCDREHVWVTSCDRSNRRAYLHQFALTTGLLERAIDITDHQRFHPGGFDTDGTSIWVPVAEYRPHSTSVIQQRNKRSLQVEFQFAVPDHIGCIAVTPESLVGGNWDSREFYVWNRRGQLIRKIANTTGNNYQDMKYESGRIVASGVFPNGAGGAIDWLEFPALRIVRRVMAGRNDRGVLFTREGMSIRAGRLLLLPEDGPSRLFIFQSAP